MYVIIEATKNEMVSWHINCLNENFFQVYKYLLENVCIISDIVGTGH